MLDVLQPPRLATRVSLRRVCPHGAQEVWERLRGHRVIAQDLCSVSQLAVCHLGISFSQNVPVPALEVVISWPSISAARIK